MGRQHLELQAADGQHLPFQRHLARHPQVGADGTAGEHRHQRRHHRDTRRWPILGYCARRDVQVNLAFAAPFTQAQLFLVRFHVAQPDPRRFAHHVAQLPGEDEVAFRPRHLRRFDEEHLATCGRPRQAGRHAGLLRPQRRLEVIARLAQELAHLVGVDIQRAFALPRPFRHLRRHLAADLADLAFQLADARLARVVADHRAQRFRAKHDLFLQQAVHRELARHQILLGDVQLVVLGIAIYGDDLHPVEQRRGNRRRGVAGADKEHLAQIEVHVQVMVAESVVLLRIEDFQQGGRWIAAPVGADFIDLVEHKDGVFDPRALEGLHNAARHCADVGAAVAANLGLVPHPAQAHPRELAVQRPRNRLPQRGLAHTGRSHQRQNRAGAFNFASLQIGLVHLIQTALLAQLAHRQEFQDALFDVFEVVVILIQHFAGVADVEIVLGQRLPRHRRQPIQVRFDDPVLGGLRRHLLQTRQLALRLLLGLLRHPRFVDLLAVLLDFVTAIFALAQFLADGVHLLAQVVFALRLLDLLFRLLLDLLADFAHFQLVRQHLHQMLHLLRQPVGLKKLLRLFHIDAHVRCQKVDEQSRLLQLLDETHRLVGELRNQLRQPRRHVQEIAAQRLFDDGVLDNVGVQTNARLEVRIGRRPFDHAEAFQPLDEDRQRAVVGAHHPVDDGCRPDLKNLRRRGNLHRGVPHRHQPDHPVALVNVFDELHRTRNPHGQRHHNVRKCDSIAQWEDRQLVWNTINQVLDILFLRIKPGQHISLQ